MIKKILFTILTLILVLLLVYFLGPTPKFEAFDNAPSTLKFDINTVEAFINEKESKVENIKEDNQSQFVWQDSFKRTEYSMVYLHGFSASHGEAQPILDNFSEKYNCNTYLPRLYLHGLNDVDAFVNLNPKDWVESAKEAIAVAKAIGEKVVIISTSTGSTLAAYLAANDPKIVALINTSPNFDLYDPNSNLLVKPWGKQLFRRMMGSDYREWEATDSIKKYWTTKNRIEAHVAIRSLLNETMTDDIFEKIKQPFYVAYYYKDDENMDKIISIDAIHDFAEHLGTPKNKIELEAFDDGKGHVISSMYMNENWEHVQNEIFDFFEKKVLAF